MLMGLSLILVMQNRKGDARCAGKSLSGHSVFTCPESPKFQIDVIGKIFRTWCRPCVDDVRQSVNDIISVTSVKSGNTVKDFPQDPEEVQSIANF